MKQIGAYRLVEEIARGGMGVVYRAQDAGGRDVALKLLSAQHAQSANARQRFVREAHVLAQLRHPNVVQILAAGEHQATLWLALEFVEGQSLETRLRAGPLPVADAVRIAQQLAGALTYLHGRGILHRDLKPDNVLLRGDQALLTDFGLARDEASEHQLTSTGVFLGTPGYWAPEQARGQTAEIGPPSDVYGLGAVLYACLTGAPPVQGATLLACLQSQAFDRTPPPQQVRAEVPDWLSQLCMRCLSTTPADRPQTAAAVLESLALREAARAPASTLRRLALAACTLVALLGLAVYGLVGQEDPAPRSAPLPGERPSASAGSWDFPAVGALPPVSAPGFSSALNALRPRDPEERAALTRLRGAHAALGDWRLAREADLAAWAAAHEDLPPRLLGPLRLLREPTAKAFHHGSHRPPPTSSNKLDNHLEDNAIQVAFVDAAGTRFVTVGNRMLKLWRWPTKLVRSVQLPKSWALTLCVVVQPSHERVFLGGRILIAESKDDPTNLFKRAGLAAYVLDESSVRVYTELASVFGRDRMHSLALHETTLVGGTNNGTLGVFRAKHKLELAGRGETTGNVNARGIAFLDDPTRFFTVSGDDNDAKFVFESYQITERDCRPQEPRLVFEQPPGDQRVFTCLNACPPFGLYAGHGREGVVARYTLEGERAEPLVDPRTGRAHFRSATSLASAREREWLVSASGWAEWEAHEADKIVHDGKLPGEPATLCIWDLKTSTLLGRYAQLHELDGFSSVAITPDGSRVLAGTAFGDVLGWDLE